MIHKRLAALAAVAGLGLSLGCSSMNNTACGTQKCGFLSRLCGRSRTAAAAALPVASPVAVASPFAGTFSEAGPLIEGGLETPDYGAPGCCPSACGTPSFDGPLLLDRDTISPQLGGIINGNGGMPLPSTPYPPIINPPVMTTPPPGAVPGVAPPPLGGRLTPTPQPPQAQPMPFTP